MKKLIAISALALVMITGSKPPFGYPAQAKATVETQQVTKVTKVRTTPEPKISYPHRELL